MQRQKEIKGLLKQNSGPEYLKLLSCRLKKIKKITQKIKKWLKKCAKTRIK